jgi:hypothetical protein
MPHASIGPSGRRRNSHAPSSTADTCAASSSASAATSPTPPSKAQPASTASEPMPSANWARKAIAKYRWSHALRAKPIANPPASESATGTH